MHRLSRGNCDSAKSSSLGLFLARINLIATMNPMKLFNDIQREDRSPRRHSESSFSFLNTSARPEAESIRKTLEQWFARYATPGKSDLRARFRNRDAQQHLGALFELYCHEFLLKQGFHMTLHVKTESEKETHPDFLAQKYGDTAFYIECVLAADPFFDPGEKARLDVVLDTLNKANSKGLSVGVEVKSIGGSSPDARSLRHLIEKWCVELCSLSSSQESCKYPELSWKQAGWHLVFSVIPHSARTELRRRARAINYYGFGCRFSDSSGILRSSLERKAKQPGVLAHPYVIAVNSLDTGLDDYDIMEALFGECAYQINEHTDESHMTRDPNGLWTSSQGPRYTRVSAVLVVRCLTPWTLSSTSAVLWQNPYARYLLDQGLLECPQMVLDETKGEMSFVQGIAAEKILRISEHL